MLPDIPYLKMTLAVFTVALTCSCAQKFFKKYLDADQYYYLKDITLIGAWALFGIWTQDAMLRITIAAAVVAGGIGFCQRVTNDKMFRCLYFLVGFAYAIFGPRVAFVEISEGQFFYLSNIISIVISGLWIGIMPIFFEELDEIPGLCGLLLMVLWWLISAVILTSPQQPGDICQLCITGIVFRMVFWSRHFNAYRRLTEPLAAFWGTLVAGVLVFAISRGTTSYALVSVVAGLLLLPVVEVTASVLSAICSPRPMGNLILYRRFINMGLEHSTAVYSFVFICTILACIAAHIFAPRHTAVALFVSMAALLLFTALLFKIRKNKEAKYSRKPQLWGITVDNISLSYALTQVNHWLNSARSAHLIITPDALAAMRSRHDARYRQALSQAGLVLPDGAGLIAAFRLLGTPIQERLPGVEFVEHLCERAAVEGWKVYILGGIEGVAEAAAKKLQSKYSGLEICGTRNGYFKEEETEAICEGIKQSGADILFAGLGVPKQEYWLADNLAKTGAVVGMGIGGSMDVISGNLKRAPKIWQKLCLEWLYRTIQEPWRAKRLTKLPEFVALVLLTKVGLYKFHD